MKVNVVGCLFDMKCPWCGEDQLPDMVANGASYDTIMEAHSEECVPYQNEINGVPQASPPCDRDEE